MSTISTIDLQNLTGLTTRQALARRKAEGPNILQAKARRTVITLIWDVLREPMLGLLLAAGILYLILGSVDEAVMLLVFVVVVITITIYQEGRTEKALESLRTLASPRALVIRDGKQQRIAGSAVVREDLVFIEEGERVPADGTVLFAHNLEIDESILTGESIPVAKLPTGGRDPRQNQVYGGTLVTQGYAVVRISAIGSQTEMGKIGQSLEEVTEQEGPLKRHMRHVIARLTVVALVVCGVVAGLYALQTHRIIDSLLSGLALAMALLPEELPVILTVFLAIGAWRIGQKHVLARRVAAVESLGAATVLCVDKTGTLTKNQLEVSGVVIEGVWQPVTHEAVPSSAIRLARAALLASRPNHPDPLEKAVREAFSLFALAGYELEKEYPLTADRLARVQVWRQHGHPEIHGAMGAPEAIMDLCHLSPAQVKEVGASIAQFSTQGLRMVAIAEGAARTAEQALPADSHDLTYHFLGLVCFTDPVRPEVAEAVASCQTAGIRVVMITGDYPGTAQSVAQQIGLPADDLITGDELQAMSDHHVAARLRSVTIFARIMPEQKLRIVQALERQGEIVVMTGDGVNDAPALKAAHIGIAMGERGTDVAREAASIVLLKDSFAYIVEGIRAGRRIFDNMRKAVTYTVAVHIPIAGLPLVGLVLGWPLILLPAHIAFMELVIDPSCSVVFEAEPEEPGIMHRPPRSAHEQLFSRQVVTSGLGQGMILLVAVVAMYGWGVREGYSAELARTLAFSTLVVGNLSLIASNRLAQGGWRELVTRNNPYWVWIVLSTIVLLAVVIAVPLLRSVFGFAVPSAAQVGMMGGASLITFSVLELWRSWSSQVKG